MRIKLLLVALALIGSQAIADPQKKTLLLPDVEQILEVSAIDESEMDQNAFVSLIAIDADDDSYQELGKQILLNERKQLQEAVEKKDFQLYMQPVPHEYKKLKIINSINGKEFEFSCYKLIQHNCIGKALKEQKAIKQLIEENEHLLTRYEAIVKQPEYQSYGFSPSGSLPKHQIYMQLSRLRLAKAVYMVNQGAGKEGVTIFHEEMEFAKRILNAEVTLIDTMTAIRQILTITHTLGELLDTNSIRRQLNNVQFLGLFKPLTRREQQAIARSMKHEGGANVIFSHLATKQYLRGYVAYLDLAKEAKQKNMPLNFNRNATINEYYKKLQNIIKIAEVALPEASKKYQEIQQEPISPKPTLEDIIEKYGSDNLLGGIVIESGQMDRDYLYRLYDASTYLALINAKLAAKRAGVSKDRIGWYLTKVLGARAVNPYTKTPFAWDADKQILSSEWLLSNNKFIDGEYPSIPFRLKD